MKKIIIFLMVLCALCACCGCQITEDVIEKTTQGYNVPDPLQDETSKESGLVNENAETQNEVHDQYLFESMIYEVGEGFAGVSVDDEAIAFSVTTYTDTEAPKTKEITLLGKAYTLTYDHSENNPIYDQSYHIYEAHGIDNGFAGLYPPYIAVDTETGHIARYSLFPYDIMPKNESECLSLIKEIIGDHVDLNEYDYNARTHFYRYSENAVGKKTEEGFYQCKENEELLEYDLYFSKCIDGVATTKRVFALLARDIFSINVFIPDYDEEIFGNSMRSVKKLEQSIYDIVAGRIDSKYTIEKCTIISKLLFVNKGVPYVLADVEVILDSGKSDENKISMLISTITEINNEDESNDLSAHSQPNYSLYMFNSVSELEDSLKNAKGVDLRENFEAKSEAYRYLVNKFESKDKRLTYPVLKSSERISLSSQIALFSSELYGLPWIWYQGTVNESPLTVKISYVSEELVDHANNHSMSETVRFISPSAPNVDNYESKSSYSLIAERMINVNGTDTDALIGNTVSGETYIQFFVDDMLVVVSGATELLSAELISDICFVSVE